MRTGPVIVGSILLVAGLAAIVVGGMMQSFSDRCGAVRCDQGEAVVIGVIGSGIFLAGALVGLAGIGLVVAGIVAEKTSRAVPVTVATPPTPMRPCPNCEAASPRSAKFCASCGAAIAPVLRA